MKKDFNFPLLFIKCFTFKFSLYYYIKKAKKHSLGTLIIQITYFPLLKIYLWIFKILFYTLCNCDVTSMHDNDGAIKILKGFLINDNVFCSILLY